MTTACHMPTWLSQVPGDAISVALLINADYRPAHAGALAWRRSREHGIHTVDYAVELSSHLAAMGLPLSVPVLEVEPSGITDRYTLCYRADRMASGGRMIVHGLEIGKERHWTKPYWVGCERSGRYASGLALDDVEPTAWRLMGRRKAADPFAALAARMERIMAAMR